MTNETITLARELAERLNSDHSYVRNRARLELRAALADPVPPADVEELPATRTNLDYQHLGDDGYVAAQTWNECLKSCTPIITRLQAEVEQLRERNGGHKALVIKHAEVLKERDTLQAELTKVRELLSVSRSIIAADSTSQLSRLFVEELDNFLSNQYAPADKGN